MFRGLDIAHPQILSRNFIRRLTFLSSRYHNASNLSFGLSGNFGSTNISMAFGAVREDGSSGQCIEETSSSSVLVAEGESRLFSLNGLVKSASGDDGRREADGISQLLSREDLTPSRDGSKEITGMLLKVSQQSIPSNVDYLVADTSSLLSTGNLRSDCSAEGVAENKEEEEEEMSEGAEGGGSAKRLRIEERVLSSSNPEESETDMRIARAWDHWRKLGEPKMHVAPMVDQSELPFRMLCRRYGATAAYTPMLHARLFAQDGKYRSKEFSTCPGDRPLFVQFCANNPDILLEAARLVEAQCDYVDINLGCPQRIAKKGNYGAFLMENLPLVKSLVSKLASNLTTPVSCKIRVFPDMEDTLAYARMLEEAGCSLLAVHGRTRDQKDQRAVRADWEAIRAVKRALRIPVLGNGNIRWVEDVHDCIAYTGVDGVMSAESLLENPALFAGNRLAHTLEDFNTEGGAGDPCSTGESSLEQPHLLKIDERALLLEYLNLCEEHPVPMRMVRGHVHKIMGTFWFKRNPDIRAELNKQHTLTLEWLKGMMSRLMTRPPAICPWPPVTQEAKESASDAVSHPLESPLKPLGSGTAGVLPIPSAEEVMSLS